MDVVVQEPEAKVSVSSRVSSILSSMPRPEETSDRKSPVELEKLAPALAKEAEPVRAVSPSVVFRAPAVPAAKTNGHSNGSPANGNGTSGLRHTSSVAGDRRTTKVKSVYYQSKYKYIDGKAAHKSEHISNMRNLSTMWPSECNGFHCNTKRAAFLVAGSSGQIGVVEV